MKRIGDFTDHLYTWCFYAGIALLLTVCSPPANAAGDVSLTLSIEDFVRRVKEKNEYIRSQNLEWAISLEAVKTQRPFLNPNFSLPMITMTKPTFKGLHSQVERFRSEPVHMLWV
nr:hypothetical protein [uncultured Desulfobacter sp.]